MYRFDEQPNRRGSDSVKWSVVAEDVLPMWVADMDLKSAPAILDALAPRAAHPYYGYPHTERALKPLIAKHYLDKYGVEVDPEWIVLAPSVISGVVNALQMIGSTFMYSVPMYDHIRSLDKEAKLPVIEVPMNCDEKLYYTMDIDALEAAVTVEVKSLILCNPHNPVGRVFTREELQALDAFCVKHGLTVISDEIHCELDLEGRHVPFFAASETAKEHSITLSSAGKICNIPGLPMGFAIIPNKELREAFISHFDGLQASGNVLTIAAYEKAYDGSCDGWKDGLREHLRGNRDIAEQRFNAIPELRTTHNEGTYLLWIDCTKLGLENPMEFFLEKAKVRVSPGTSYGNPNFVRFNFGCTREQMIEAIDRMEHAINAWREEK